jgi:hypothetical protein
MTGGFESQSASSVRRRYGRLAGLLYIGGAIVLPPSLMLVQPYLDEKSGVGPGIWALSALSLAIGIGLVFADWDRLSDRWLHFAPAAAIPQILIANLISDGHSNFYYVLGIGYVALVFRSRRLVVAYVAAIWVAMFAPLVLEPSDNGVTLGVGLIAAPTVAALAAMTVVLREQFERARHSYHELAWRTIQASGEMLRTERDRDALEALADELRERDRETQESAIALEPRIWRRRFEAKTGDEELAEAPAAASVE